VTVNGKGGEWRAKNHPREGRKRGANNQVRDDGGSAVMKKSRINVRKRRVKLLVYFRGQGNM